MEVLNENDKIIEEAIDVAFDSRNYAYTPYSNFKVGAALICKNKQIYGGCNIENSSYGATNCAERTAFYKAISDGIKDFIGIVIVGGKDNDNDFDYCAPCGICRQVMTEFCDLNNFKIILAKSKSDYKVFTLEQMLPYSFTKKDLER